MKIYHVTTLMSFISIQKPYFELEDYASNTAYHKRVLSPIPKKAEQTPDSGIREIASLATYYMLRA